MRILFIGNSYTFCNDLPATVAALALSRGHLWPVGRYLRGGASLKTHVLDNAGTSADRGEFGLALDPARTGGLDALLAQGPWDAAVLQGQSMDTVATLGDFLTYGGVLASMLRAAGTSRLVLYQTWARQQQPEMQAAVTAGYAKLAEAIGAEVAAVGEAWQRALALEPGRILHVADQSHPNGCGSYLAACVLYRQLSGEPAIGLPAVFPEIVDAKGQPCYDLDAATARQLQLVAG